jgi:hypothetical protein
VLPSEKRHSESSCTIARNAAFKAHLAQVRKEKHAQIERDQGAASFPQDSWMIITDFMQDLFQLYLCHRPKL